MAMVNTQADYPVIDVFAGPGGLGEGFASYADPSEGHQFHSVASFERDEFSYQTLRLRHFLRAFPRQEIPDDYYDYLAGGIAREELYRRFPGQEATASLHALKISLGPDNHDSVKGLISERLAARKKWVLVGGPPCQAYSLVGRARMKGNPDFEQDERHFLYREYLKIIVDHRPPVFVMENVKGLLSAKVGGKPVINRIIRDLSRPKAALEDETNGLEYSLYPLAVNEVADESSDPKMFIVRAEEHGVPQARHRMFIMGVRNDLDIRPGQLSREDAPTVRQTIGNLPAIRSGVSRQSDSFEAWCAEIEKLAEIPTDECCNGSDYASPLAQQLQLNLSSRSDRPSLRSSKSYPAAAPKEYGGSQANV